MDSADDDFKKAVADVEPLRRRKRVELKHSLPGPAPVARQRQRDEAAALAETLAGPMSVDDALDAGEDGSYLRDGVARHTLRRLRRGQLAIQAGIDLHGLTREQAAAEVNEFLRQCLARGHRCVRIVHGKGLGVLKAKLRKWLPQRDEVLAYCEAPAHEGGSGALLVLLKSKR